MDPDLISEKLESLRRCVQRVQKKCPATPEELMEDPDLQDIISLNLTRAVQLSVDTVATGVHPPQDAVASGSHGFALPSAATTSARLTTVVATASACSIAL